MSAVDRAVGVYVNARGRAAGGLRLEHAVQRGGAALCDEPTGGDAAVVGQDDVQAVFVEHVDRKPIEEVPVPHYPRIAGRSQFFRWRSLLSTLGQLLHLLYRARIAGTLQAERVANSPAD